MKKVIFAGLVLSALHTTVWAKNFNDLPFIGIGVGNIIAQTTQTTNGIEGTPIEKESAGIALTIGTFHEESSICIVNYTHSQTDAIKISALDVSYSWFYVLTENLLPFLGVNVSYYNSHTTGLLASGYSDDTLTISTTSLGITAGVTYEFAEDFMLLVTYSIPVATKFSDASAILGADSLSFTATPTAICSASLIYNF